MMSTVLGTSAAVSVAAMSLGCFAGMSSSLELSNRNDGPFGVTCVMGDAALSSCAEQVPLGQPRNPKMSRNAASGGVCGSAEHAASYPHFLILSRASVRIDRMSNGAERVT